MKYKMLALDIDGTLTNDKKEITPATKKAIIDIQEKGVKVVIASGRPTPGTRRLADELRFSDYNSYILSYNGAKILDCGTKEIIYNQTLSSELIPEIYEAAMTHCCGLMSYEGDGVITATDIDNYMALEARINRIPIRKVNHFLEHVTFPVNKCLMTAEPEHLAKVEKILAEQFSGRISVYRSEPFFLELMPIGIDKGSSLSHLLSSLHMTREELVACGDGFNDISMIRYAGLGVAMENAQPAAKKEADFITASNNDDGIALVIDKFFR